MSDPRTLHRQWSMLRMIPRHPAQGYRFGADLSVGRSRLLGRKRTVERDLIMLESLFGLEVDDRSRPHGWCWSADSTGLDLRALSEEEALMLKSPRISCSRCCHPVWPVSYTVFVAAQRLEECVGSRRLKAWAAKIAFDHPLNRYCLPMSYRTFEPK